MISDKSKYLKLIITRVSAFIGSNLINYFLYKASWKILNIDKFLSKTNDKFFAKHKNRYQFDDIIDKNYCGICSDNIIYYKNLINENK